MNIKNDLKPVERREKPAFSLERERDLGERERIPLPPTAPSLNLATDLAFFNLKGAEFLCPVAVCGFNFLHKNRRSRGSWSVGHSISN